MCVTGDSQGILGCFHSEPSEIIGVFRTAVELFYVFVLVLGLSTTASSWMPVPEPSCVCVDILYSQPLPSLYL